MGNTAKSSLKKLMFKRRWATGAVVANAFNPGRGKQISELGDSLVYRVSSGLLHEKPKPKERERLAKA